MAIEQIRAEITRCEYAVGLLQADNAVKKAEVLKPVDVCAAYEMVAKIVNNVQRIFVTVLYALASAITVGLVPLADLVIKMIRSGKKEKVREEVKKRLQDLQKKLEKVSAKILSLKTAEQAELTVVNLAEREKLRLVAEKQAEIAARAAAERAKEERAALLVDQEDATFVDYIVPMINDSIKHVGADAKACTSKEQLDEKKVSVKEKIDAAQEETLETYEHFSDRIKDQIREKYEVYRQRYEFVLGSRVDVVESMEPFVADLEGRLNAGEDMEQVREGFVKAVNASRDVQLLDLRKLGFDTSEEEGTLAAVFSEEVHSVLKQKLKAVIMPKVEEAVKALFIGFEGISSDGTKDEDAVVKPEEKFGQIVKLQDDLKQKFVESGFGEYGDEIVDEIFTALARSFRSGSFDNAEEAGDVDGETEDHDFVKTDVEASVAAADGESPSSEKVSGSGSEGGDDTDTADEGEDYEEKVQHE